MNNRFNIMADIGGGDLPGDVTTTAVLTPGVAVDGSIAFADDADWYRIDLVAGQVYYLSVISDDPAMDSYLKLLKPGLGGTQTWTDNNSGAGSNAAYAFRAYETGTYYLSASGYAGTTGTYNVKVTAAPADDVTDDYNNGQLLTVGTAFDGVISDDNDRDSFRVALLAGHSYVFVIDSLASGSNAGFTGMARVFGAGSPLMPDVDAMVSAGGTTTVFYQAAQDITLSAMVNYSYGLGYPVADGGYRVRVIEAPADVGGTAATATPLSVGAIVVGTFPKDPGSPPDQDWFSVSLIAGQTYVINGLPGTGGPDTTLYDSALHVLAVQSVDMAAGPRVYTAAVTGTFYLGVVTHYGNYGGAYQISVSLAPADLPADATTNGRVVVGDATTGESSAAGDGDWYAVDLVAGLTYALRMGGAVANSALVLATHLELVTAAGGVLASDDGAGLGVTSEIIYTAAQTGRYYLAAQLFAPGVVVGTYGLSATIIGDEAGATAATSRSMTLGQTVNGNSDFIGDHDWYSVTLQAGWAYEFSSGDVPIAVRGADAEVITAPVQGWQQTHFVAPQSGTYYIDVGGVRADTPYSLTLKRLDDVGDTPQTLAHLAVGQTLTGKTDYAFSWNDFKPGDADWYAITLQAGHSYSFTLTPAATEGVNYTQLLLRGADGASVAGQGGNCGATLTYVALNSGTFYVDAMNYLAGSYSLSAQETPAPPHDSEIADSIKTQAVLAIGSSQVSDIAAKGDQDWYRVELTAGQHYAFTVTQAGATPLGDCFVALYDQNGSKLGWDDDGGASWPNSLLRFTPVSSGTYYVAASGFETATGTYSVAAQVVPDQKPLDTIDWGTQVANTTVQVYFAKSGDVYADHTAQRDWTSDEIADFLRAGQAWQAVTNVSFVQTASAASAGMIVVLDSLNSDLAGFMQTPPATPQVGVFAPYWGAGKPVEGSYYFQTFIHEIGHFLGLAHPHDTGGTSQIMEGVYDDSHYGTYGLNQSVYTVMSYNSGYNGQYSAIAGNPSTPMALDIAAVQADYGVRAANTGDTTYDVAAAKGYQAIWDTGGTDSLVYSGAGNITLDLRPATLLNAVGGGGYLSRQDGGYQGYTIAHGVVIENAAGGAGNDTLIGNDTANTLQGMAGDDVIHAGRATGGTDKLDGGTGTDRLTFEDLSAGIVFNLASVAAQDTGQGMVTGSGFENLTGSAYNDTLSGGSGVNFIDGGAGNDQLHGTGNDTLSGGLGDDSYYLNVAGDTVLENYDGAGIDTVFAAFDLVLGTYSWVENGVLTGAAVSASAQYGNVGLTGNGLANILTSGNGNDTLDGAGGADQMTGSWGDDLYYVDNANDSIIEVYGAGADTVRASATYDISALFVENFELIGGAAIDAYGNALDNAMTGNAAANRIDGRSGDDVLHGGGGADTLVGGLGDDTFYIDSGQETVVEAPGGGTDTLYSARTFVLGDQAVEILILTGAANANLTGSALANRLVGNDAGNTLFGLGGDDVLDGRGGADNLVGGAGNDTLYVDNAADAVFEGTGGGNDTVIASVSWAMTVGQEIEGIVLAPGARDAKGNAFANGLTGNNAGNVLSGDAGDDTLSGMMGSDTLSGGAGHDLLLGGDGDDLLDGGTDGDALSGGRGSDTYSVENVGDVVTELSGEGTADTVKTNLANYTLGANVENLILTGSGTINGTGNGLGNLIIGNGADNALIGGQGDDTLSGGAGNDLLNGGTGADRLIGGAGNDTYQLGSGDTIIEAADGGVDTVLTSLVTTNLGPTLENVTLIGSALNANGNGLANVMIGNGLNNTLQGGNGADTIDGRAGNDTINGGGGADNLHGGLGADVFVYRALADSAVGAMDLIDDFIGADNFDFRQIDANIHLAGDQAFQLVGVFGHHEGELVLSFDAGSNRTTVMADVNGDALADMSILLAGHISSVAGWLM